jgi:zinc/manganese transport system substrate-binding protein
MSKSAHILRSLQSRRRHRSLAFVGIVAISALGLLAACGGSSSSASAPTTIASVPKPLVIATTPILGDLVRQVGGDTVDVEVLIPLGADPHDFEPSAAQAARLRDASLIVANGLGLEENLESTLEGARKDGVTVFEVGEGVDPIAIAAEENAADEHSEEGHSHKDDHAEEGHSHKDDHAEEGHTEEKATTEDTHGHGAEDPHFWLDPERMATAASLVAAQLATTTGLDAAGFQSRAASYADAAKAAMAEATEILSVVPADQRKMITNHDALEYFAQRFNLEVIGTVIPGGSTMAEPSAADLKNLVQLIKANNVKALFSESTVSSKLIETVSREVGSQVQVVELSTDTLGEPGSATATYPGLIVTTARLIANGLTGR